MTSISATTSGGESKSMKNTSSSLDGRGGAAHNPKLSSDKVEKDVDVDVEVDAGTGRIEHPLRRWKIKHAMKTRLQRASVIVIVFILLPLFLQGSGLISCLFAKQDGSRDQSQSLEFELYCLLILNLIPFLTTHILFWYQISFLMPLLLYVRCTISTDFLVNYVYVMIDSLSQPPCLSN